MGPEFGDIPDSDSNHLNSWPDSSNSGSWKRVLAIERKEDKILESFSAKPPAVQGLIIPLFIPVFLIIVGLSIATIFAIGVLVISAFSSVGVIIYGIFIVYFAIYAVIRAH